MPQWKAGRSKSLPGTSLIPLLRPKNWMFVLAKRGTPTRRGASHLPARRCAPEAANQFPRTAFDNCVLRGSPHAYEEFGVDALRYYLLRHIRSTGDADFSRERFRQAYESELAGPRIRKTFNFTFAG